MNKYEKQSIYEIYRACRLCGAGAGYKMPIIQSVIDADGEETELKQKIRECVQIEVNLNDKLPPLVCELCVDKINDFFDFRAMCHEINRKTRLRLGLPLQTTPKEEPASDCNRGDTETVCIDSDSDEEKCLSKRNSNVKSKPGPKSAKIIKESDVKIEIVSYQPVLKKKPRSPSPEVKERREMRRGPSPKRTTRQNTRTDDFSLSDLQGLQIQKSTRARPAPRSVKNQREEFEEDENEMTEENSLLVPRMKRPREKELIVDLSSKKPKLPEPPKPENAQKPGPKSSKLAPRLVPPQKQPLPPTKAGPKSRKRDPSPPPLVTKPIKSESTPSPGPKSRKSESTPSLGPKSRKSESTPSLGPKSRKSESQPIAAPKSKKPEVSTPPAPKSRIRENSPASTSKSRRREPTPPAHKSKKREREPSPKIERVSPLPQKTYECIVCGVKAKAAQGLSSHMKIHTAAPTPIKLSCNACELWFSTADDATWHHKRHANKGLPYTCAKCYDDFRTTADYELHFTRNQCLPTYEVPDVKCDECWHYYPTYKLLEDHKCPGEGGRPGGKCPKCKRSYALLKTLTAHEMRCNVKKKVAKEPTVAVESTPLVDPEISSRLLSMQVRISKCDPLLKNSTVDRYDVSGVSHRFGLDHNFTYPYLYSMGNVRIKTEPSTNTCDHMVSIKDEIKEEYLKEDSYVHWDSDISEDSDSGTLFNAFKKKSVDTLSTISLKIIFSPKCLGKVPRKKRKIKSEKGFQSIMSIDFHRDIKQSIDNIIDSLGNDSQHSDNYDSDSVLSKTIDQNKENKVDILYNFKSNVMDNIGTFESTVEDAKAKDVDSKETDKTDSASNVANINLESSKNEETVSEEDPDLKQNISDHQNTDKSQDEHVEIQANKDINEVTNLSNAKADEVTNIDSLQQSSSSSNATENNLDLESKITEEVAFSQNNNDHKLKENAKSSQEVSEQIVSEKESLPIEDKVEISTSQTEIEKMDVDEQIESKSTNNADISSSISESAVVKNETEKEKSLPNNDDINTETDDSQSSVTINYKVIEDFNAEKDNTQSSIATNDKINHNEHISTEWDNDAEKDDAESDAVNDKINHCDNITTEMNIDGNDDQPFAVTNDKTNYCDNSITESGNAAIDGFSTNIDCINKVSDKNVEETISNSITFQNSDAIEDGLDRDVQSADKFNINDLSDEDKRLMADLDAQIGESEPNSNVIGENGADSSVIGENTRDDYMIGGNKSLNKINRNDSPSIVIASVGFNDMNTEENIDNLDALIQKQDDLKSLDLDSISDEEFNFDI